VGMVPGTSEPLIGFAFMITASDGKRAAKQPAQQHDEPETNRPWADGAPVGSINDPLIGEAFNQGTARRNGGLRQPPDKQNLEEKI
jgi:hypothetical protein